MSDRILIRVETLEGSAWKKFVAEATDMEDMHLENAEERLAWDIYFASLCAMSYHPGNRQAGVTLEDTADFCDEMILERRRRLTCHG